MRIVILMMFLSAVLISCGKVTDVKPAVAMQANKATDSGLSVNAADAMRKVMFEVSPQTVKATVSDKMLTLKYDENISLLLTAEGYAQTQAVHLTEDFKNSALSGFDYTTVAERGNVTLNWVDDNLNNVPSKTIKDTVINNAAMVKVTVHRSFTFFKVYDTVQLAAAEQAFLAAHTGDVINFSSYCYFSFKNYPGSSVTAKLTYMKF